jgi:hypothetical protein
MEKCPSNKIYNPRTNRCINNNKINIKKIIKDCSEAYSKLQKKVKSVDNPKPASKPAPKPAPNPVKMNSSVCKVNVKTGRCSKMGTVTPEKCETAPSGKCRIKKMPKIEKKVSTSLSTTLTETESDSYAFTVLQKPFPKPVSFTPNTCLKKTTDLTEIEKIISKISHEKLYSSVAIKHNSVKDIEKKEWFEIFMFIQSYKINGIHLAKCSSYKELCVNISISPGWEESFTLKLYNKLKKHINDTFYKKDDDDSAGGGSKSGNKEGALLLLKDVQKYIKAKDLDNTESFKWFSGTSIVSYAFLLSLLKRHKNDCVVIDLYENNDIPSATDRAGRFSNMKGLIERVKNCAKRKKFAVIPFGIGSKGGNHVNVIIYNPITDTFEHYEPHGRKLHRVAEKTYLTKWRKKFEGTITRNTKYYPPMDTACLLPPGSYQGIQKEDEYFGDLGGEELEIYKYAMNDTGGYCVAYSMYIADQRLDNPTMRPEEVYLKAIQDASGQSYTELRKDVTNIKYKKEIISFIRQYARTYMDVLQDCMEIYSQYTLLSNKKTLTSSEKMIFNRIYNRLCIILNYKLKEHSG